MLCSNDREKSRNRRPGRLRSDRKLHEPHICQGIKLPIKHLPKTRKLYNVDGTENKAGELQFYTDLEVRTGKAITRLRFFLTELGEHKAILGYSWFAAAQPKIDWKKGWIDHSQLPIILKAPNAQKA